MLTILLAAAIGIGAGATAFILIRDEILAPFEDRIEELEMDIESTVIVLNKTMHDYEKLQAIISNPFPKMKTIRTRMEERIISARVNTPIDYAPDGVAARGQMIEEIASQIEPFLLVRSWVDAEGMHAEAKLRVLDPHTEVQDDG